MDSGLLWLFGALIVVVVFSGGWPKFTGSAPDDPIPTFVYRLIQISLVIGVAYPLMLSGAMPKGSFAPGMLGLGAAYMATVLLGNLSRWVFRRKRAVRTDPGNSRIGQPGKL